MRRYAGSRKQPAGDDAISSDHERLTALRRITVKRGATAAEAATAKRLADALEAKVGKGHASRSRRGAKKALAEPPAARKRRVWGIRLDWAYEKTYWICLAACALFFALSVPLLLMILAAPLDVDHSQALLDRVLQLMFYKYVMLAVVTCFAIVIGGPIALAAWWLRTMRGERLGPPLAFMSTFAPVVLIGIATLVAVDRLERALSSRNPLIVLSLIAVAYLLTTAWYRWVHPRIELWLAANFKMG